MTSFDIDPALLPAPGEAPRCAEHADAIDLDPVGSALRVAMIRALGRQLAVANAELTMHDLESKRQIARMRAGVSLETYGAQEAEDDLPAYLTKGG